MMPVNGIDPRDLDLEIESTLFTEYASVGALKKHPEAGIIDFSVVSKLVGAKLP